jgi:hypothetical protein
MFQIIWNCNLDVEDFCYPIYKFKRFDLKEQNASSGFNFRFDSPLVRID